MADITLSSGADLLGIGSNFVYCGTSFWNDWNTPQPVPSTISLIPSTSGERFIAENYYNAGIFSSILYNTFRIPFNDILTATGALKIDNLSFTYRVGYAESNTADLSGFGGLVVATTANILYGTEDENNKIELKVTKGKNGSYTFTSGWDFMTSGQRIPFNYLSATATLPEPVEITDDMYLQITLQNGISGRQYKPCFGIWSLIGNAETIEKKMTVAE